MSTYKDRLKPLNRCIGLQCRAVEGQSNSREISFSSEEPYRRWFGNEILQHTTESVDLSRFGDVATVLFSHGRDPVVGRMPIAKPEKVWLDEAEHKCRAIITFDEDDETSMKLLNKLDKGMLSGVSVGYNVDAWMSLDAGATSPDGRFVGPAEIAVKWTPYEISLEPTPADATVGFGKSIENDNTNTEEEKGMSKPNSTQEPAAKPTTTATVTTAAPSGEAARTIEQVLQEERTRCAQITDLCRSVGLDPTEYMENGSTLDEVRAVVCDTFMKGRNPVAAGMGGDVTVTADEMDKVRAAATDGLLMRGGIAVNKPAAGAESFRGMSLRDIAVETLIRSGVADANRMSRDDIFKRVMMPDSAFGAIAANVARNSASTAYEDAPVTYPIWTCKGTFTDFRPTDIWQISAAEEPELVPQNGELKHGKMGDQKMATRQGVTYGKIFTMTRQTFINDDISLITRMPAAYTIAARRLINRLVYKILKDNPIMPDGSELFSSKHGNLGTAAAPGKGSYSEARRLMRKQTDISGKQVLNISPAFVLSSSLDETENEILLASLADPSSNNAGVVNPFRNKMQLVVDAELDVDSGAQPYYFAGAPGINDTIEVATLNGVDAPMIETRMAFNTLGMEFRIFEDLAVTLLDYKALVKNPGNA